LNYIEIDSKKPYFSYAFTRPSVRTLLKQLPIFVVFKVRHFAQHGDESV